MRLTDFEPGRCQLWIKRPTSPGLPRVSARTRLKSTRCRLDRDQLVRPRRLDRALCLSAFDHAGLPCRRAGDAAGLRLSVHGAAAQIEPPSRRSAEHPRGSRGSSGCIQPFLRHTESGWLAATPKKFTLASECSGESFALANQLGRKLVPAIGHVFSAEDAEAQHFRRSEFGAEVRVKIATDGCNENIPITLLHPIVHDYGSLFHRDSALSWVP